MAKKNIRNLACKVARQQWGTELQRITRIAPGMWDFTTAGHGGIVCDTDRYPHAKKWSVPVLIRYNSCYGYNDEQHFAAFEEDCDWAIIHYLYESRIDYKKVFSNYSLYKGTFEQWLEWYKGCVKNTINSYYSHMKDELDQMKAEIEAAN